MNSKNILLSGSSGFLGNFLKHSSLPDKYKIIPVSRLSSNQINEAKLREDLDKTKESIAIHLAGLAHETKKSSNLDSYVQANMGLTESFLHSAAEVGVKHFIFFSTIKVYGDGYKSEPIRENSLTNPSDIYSRTKLFAEEIIQKKAPELGMSYTILRPPLIYGPNPKANVLSLMRWIDKGLPIPISSRTNKRSFVSTYNIASMLDQIIESIDLNHQESNSLETKDRKSQNSQSKNQVLLIQDPSPISTADFINALGIALGKNPRTLKIPNLIGQSLLGILGKSGAWSKMNGDLFIDDSISREILNWKPPISTEAGISAMVQGLFKI